jgi:hypothetical protein
VRHKWHTFVSKGFVDTYVPIGRARGHFNAGLNPSLAERIKSRMNASVLETGHDLLAVKSSLSTAVLGHPFLSRFLGFLKRGHAAWFVTPQRRERRAEYEAR